MLLCVILLLISAESFAADSRDHRISFDIPALPLGKSLEEFGAQANVDLTIPAEIPKRRLAPAIRGRLLGAGGTRTIAGPVCGQSDIPRRRTGPLWSSNRSRCLPTAPATETVTITGAVPETLAPNSATLNTDQQRTENDASSYIVFTREAMARSGAMDVRSFLRTDLPSYSPRGVWLGGAAISGLGDQITVRGLPSSQTLILFDGHRRASSYAGGDLQQPDVATVPLLFLERIDVRTASASALSGADAAAGSINLVRNRKTPRTRFFLRTEELTGVTSSTQEFGAEHVTEGGEADGSPRTLRSFAKAR